MTPLEERYRAVLKLLPRRYREVWEEDMVATFLSSVPGFYDPYLDDPEAEDPEAAAPDYDDPDYDDPEATDSDRGDPDFDPEFARPSWSEIASVVALAVRLRVELIRSFCGGMGASPRNVAWGAAVRLIALAGLLVHAVTATSFVVGLLWLDGRIPGVARPAIAVELGLPSSSWHDLWTGGFAWMPAFFALVLGYRRAARGLVVVAVLPVMMGTIALQRLDGWAPFDLRMGQLAAVILLNAGPALALFAGFHRDAPPVRRPAGWIAAYALLLATMLGLWVSGLGRRLVLDEPAFYVAIFLVAAVIHLIGRARPSADRDSPWALALALIAPVLLVSRTTTLFQYRQMPADSTRFALTTGGLAEAVAVLIVTVPLTVLAVRSLHQAPRRSTAPTNPSSPRP